MLKIKAKGGATKGTTHTSKPVSIRKYVPLLQAARSASAIEPKRPAQWDTSLREVLR
jgi:hypothetical protein